MRAIILHTSLLLALAGALPPAWSAAPAAEPIVVQSAAIVVAARAGDTLSSIARRYTTRQENWSAIGKLNRITADTAIPVGTRITIPAELLADDPVQAKVSASSGSIRAFAPDGRNVPLAPGAKLTEGMQIETGSNSFVTLVLPDQSRVSLPSNSRIKLAKLRAARYTNTPRTEILLVRGKVESNVAPLKANQGRYEVRTPLSVAAVRGTHFRVGASDTAAATEVLSGQVGVGQAGKPSDLLLDGGYGNLIDAKSVGKPVKLLPPPQLASPPTRVGRSGVQVALAPVAGANAYQIQLFAGAERLLQELRSDTPRISLDGVTDGEYRLLVASIDKHGLQGAVGNYALSLDAATPAATAVPLQGAPVVDRGDARQLSLSWPGQAGQSYTVQVARDPAFSWLVYNLQTQATQARFPRPPFGTYYARVRATNADGSTGGYSLAQPFVVTDQWIIHDGNPISASSNSSSGASGALR